MVTIFSALSSSSEAMMRLSRLALPAPAGPGRHPFFWTGAFFGFVRGLGFALAFALIGALTAGFAADFVLPLTGALALTGVLVLTGLDRAFGLDLQLGLGPRGRFLLWRQPSSQLSWVGAFFAGAFLAFGVLTPGLRRRVYHAIRRGSKASARMAVELLGICAAPSSTRRRVARSAPASARTPAPGAIAACRVACLVGAPPQWERPGRNRLPVLPAPETGQIVAAHQPDKSRWRESGVLERYQRIDGIARAQPGLDIGDDNMTRHPLPRHCAARR